MNACVVASGRPGRAGGVAHRGDDVDIGAAAANVSGYALADLLVGQRRRSLHVEVGGHGAGNAALRFLEEGDARQDLAGRAVSALERVALEERRLDGTQARFREPLDAHDTCSLEGRGEGEAGIDAPAVDEDRAGAALAAIAALLGSGQVQSLAQRVEQRRAGIELELLRLAV